MQLGIRHPVWTAKEPTGLAADLDLRGLMMSPQGHPFGWCSNAARDYEHWSVSHQSVKGYESVQTYFRLAIYRKRSSKLPRSGSYCKASEPSAQDRNMDLSMPQPDGSATGVTLRDAEAIEALSEKVLSRLGGYDDAETLPADIFDGDHLQGYAQTSVTSSLQAAALTPHTPLYGAGDSSLKRSSSCKARITTSSPSGRGAPRSEDALLLFQVRIATRDD